MTDRASAEGLLGFPDHEPECHCHAAVRRALRDHRDSPPAPDRADLPISQRLDEAHARGFREGYRLAEERSATPDRADLVTDHHATDPHWHDPDGVTLHYATPEVDHADD